MADPDKKLAAVYVSWKTFQNSIEQLSKGEIPNVIDKTVFTGMAFSIQNQLFAGMRFLGLIDEKSKPTPWLEALVDQDEGVRKARLRDLLQRRYAELLALNLKKSTPDEIAKTMTEAYGVTGDTREKAARFFINAADYAGIELSPLLLGTKSNGSRGTATRKRVIRKQAAQGQPGNISSEKSGTSKTVRLQSGGTLTLSATLDLFSLNSEDRKFVFEFIDKLDTYQQPDQKQESA